MASYTTFLNALNLYMLTREKGKYCKQFQELQTDEERIILSLNTLLEYNQMPEVCSDIKDAKESQKLRVLGNNIFISTPITSSTCIEALKLYTKCIAYAPDSSEYLALGYANRSAVLLKLHRYEDCIQDIDRALTFTHTNNIRAKLYIRKIECLTNQNYQNTDDAIKKVQCLLENMDLDDIFRKRLNEKLSFINANVKPQTIKKHNVINKLLDHKIMTYNDEVPCASDAVAITFNEEYGRHVVATRDISSGEVIATETVYCELLSPNNIYTHCSYCSKVSWANIPCNYCTAAMYCSEDCKTLAWKKYHDVECAVFPTLLKLDFTKLDLLSLRVAIQAVREAVNIQEVKDILHDVDNCKDARTKGFSKDGIFMSDSYRSVLGLATNSEKRSAQDLFRRSIDACFILYLVATRTTMFGIQCKSLPDLIQNKDVTFFGSLILRHQQQIPSNGHSIAQIHGTEEVERGIALLPFLSLFNHSCNPNIARYSKSRCEIAYAIFPIEKGAQIFHNYGQNYGITPKVWRQKELLKQYYFICNCRACREDWPTFHSLKSFTSLVKDTAVRSKISHAIRKLFKYVDMVETRNITDKNILKDLIRMIEIMYKSVPMPCHELICAVETFIHLNGLNGDELQIPEL